MELGWRNEDEQRAWWAFLDLWRALGSGIERQLATSGVSGADYQMLAPLAGGPDEGLRPRDLSARSGWDASRVAHQLRRMEQRGLVKREDLPGDGRGVIVRLTPAGRETLERAAPGHVQWVKSNFIDLLSQDELDTLTDLSQRAVAKLDRS